MRVMGRQLLGWIAAGLYRPSNPINPEAARPPKKRAIARTGSNKLPIERLGTTDDCGFAPFADDVSTAREIAFQKIQARVEGTALAERHLGI